MLAQLIISAILSMFSALFSDTAALVWLAIALIAAILEVSVPHFGSAFVSAAAVLAAAVALAGYGMTAQVATFVVVLAVSIVGLRSRLVSRIGGQGVPSRTGPLIGKHAVVTQEIEPRLGTGRVNVGGEDWAARSSAAIEAGATVRVTGADGIVLEVTRV
jgi:membrane protein implicated in regulation of membrane protease activity